MKSVALMTYPRSLLRRAGVRKVRANGRVPAVVYGRRSTPQNLEVPLKSVQDMIKHSASEHVLVDLSVDGDTNPKRLAMVKDVQHHPLTGSVLHIDFHEVAEDEQVVITVPVESTGEAVGVKVGRGVLEHVLFNLKVRGLPKDLPEIIQVDVTNLEVGQSIHIGDLPAPPGVELLGDKRIVVMSVAEGIAETQEATVAPELAGAATAEPEMIKEKKEEAAPAGGKKK